MPRAKNSSLKDPELYEELRKDGNAKEKAARISYAAAKRGRSTIGRKGGESGSYDDWTVDELQKKARDLGLHGYSRLKKAELVDALRTH